MKNKKLYIVVNEDKFFLSHRKEVGVGALKAGWDVTVVAKNTGSRHKVEELGLRFVELPVNPTGKKLHQEFRTFKFLRSLYAKDNDVIVHHVGLKNIVWGGLAARMRGIDGVINAVSGLGIIFSEINPSRLKKVLVPLLRWGMNTRNVSIIFQNNEDRKLFESLNISKKAHIHFLKGSGVDLTQYPGNAHSQEDGPLRVIFAGRMVKDKGVLDFIKAAEILRPRFEGHVEFVLCGSLSSNAFAVSGEELERLCDGRYIKYLGYRDDMPAQFQKSDIMCFPSYYREGVPKALLDASAAGLPIVTCNSIGCKDTVEEGVNGFMVRPQSPGEVADRLETLLEDMEKRREMGRNSRLKAEKEYDVRDIVERHLDIYAQALKRKK